MNIQTIPIPNNTDRKRTILSLTGGYYNPKWDKFTFLPNKEYVILKYRAEHTTLYSIMTKQMSQIVVEHFNPEYGINFNRYYQQFADMTQEQRDKYKGDYKYECGESVLPKANNASANAVWTTNRKAAFRATPQWKDFRNSELEKRKLYKCDDCNQMFDSLEVHHLVPAEYDNLIPFNFKCLCRNCHQIRTERGE